MNYIEMVNKWFTDYISVLYDNDDIISVLLINFETKDTKQYTVNIKDIEKHLKYLRYMNTNKYNVYFSVNTLRTNNNNRKTENFNTEQRALYFDLDSKHISANQLVKMLYDEIKNNRLPNPSMIIKSSTGNYQLYFVFENKISFDILQSIMKYYNEKFKLDFTHDIARVFRPPGFRNWKPNKNDLVMMPSKDILWINKDKNEYIQITNKRISNKWLDIIQNNIQNIITENITNDIKDNSNNNKSALEKLKELQKNIQKGYTEYKTYTEYTTEYNLDDIYKRMESKGNKSKSEVDISFMIYCISHNINEEQIKNYIRNKRDGEKRTLDDYIERTYQKAKEYVVRKNNLNLNL